MGSGGGGREGRTLSVGPMYMLMASNQLFTEDGILPGLGKKTQKQREDAFLRLLSNFTVEQQQQNLPDRVDLMAFFDLLDEHNVQVEDKEVDDLCSLADSKGHIDQSRLLDYSRSSNYWQILIKKDVYADPEVLKLMTKTYDLSGREKGPPKISKLDTINKQINKVTSAQEEGLQNNSRSAQPLPPWTRTRMGLSPRRTLSAALPPSAQFRLTHASRNLTKIKTEC